MKCDEARPLVAAYHDGELEAMRAVELEQHVRSCESCARSLENLRTLRKAALGAAFSAPADLRENVFAAIGDSQPNAKIIPLHSRSRWWLTSGLPLAAAVMFGFFVGHLFERSSPNGALLTQLADSHVRSLIGTHLIDVASTDQHTVRPWFEGKLDFAPPVEDLSAVGFPLVGGRVDYIAGRAVAVLVYQRRQHFINLFIWPAAGEKAIAADKAQRGYNSVDWNTGGMTFWALSEINADELRNFARDFQAAH